MLIYDSLAAKESLNTTWFNRDRRGKRNVGGSGNRRWDVLWPICKWVFLFPQPFGILSWFQLLGPKGSVTHVLVQEGLGHFREILSRGRERARVIRGVWRIICVPGWIKLEFLLPRLRAPALASSVGTRDGEEWAAPCIEPRALPGTAGCL